MQLLSRIVDEVSINSEPQLQPICTNPIRRKRSHRVTPNAGFLAPLAHAVDDSTFERTRFISDYLYESLFFAIRRSWDRRRRSTPITQGFDLPPESLPGRFLIGRECLQFGFVAVCVPFGSSEPDLHAGMHGLASSLRPFLKERSSRRQMIAS